MERVCVVGILYSKNNENVRTLSMAMIRSPIRTQNVQACEQKNKMREIFGDELKKFTDFTSEHVSRLNATRSTHCKHSTSARAMMNKRTEEQAHFCFHAPGKSNPLATK